MTARADLAMFLSPSAASATLCGVVRSIDELTPGTILGRYECLLPIARGGQAAVWAARATGARGFEKILAIKVMLPGLSEDSNFERMFLDEARIASRIQHPNVVGILDLGEQGNLLYLAMEYVEGETLYELMRLTSKHGIPLPIAIKIVMDVASGLHAAHELKQDGVPLDLVHRDVSPQNVMISTTGIVKVLDFGVARTKGRLSQVTADGYVKGKTNYMAPEQIMGQSIDRRTDIFALGVILYQLVTGTHPFRGETEGQTLHNILRGRVPKPSSLKKDLPPTLEQIVLRTLERESEFRFQTAQDLYKALDETLTSKMRATSEDVAAFIKPWFSEHLQSFRTALGHARKVAVSAEGARDDAAQQPGARAILETQPDLGAISMERSRSPVRARRVPSNAPAPLARGAVPGEGSRSWVERLLHTRKPQVPIAIVLGMLLVSGVLVLLSRWKAHATPSMPGAVPSSAHVVAEAPLPAESTAVAGAGSADLAASTSASSATTAIPSASVVGAAPSGAAPRTTGRPNPRKSKGAKGTKTWTPPVTESGL